MELAIKPHFNSIDITGKIYNRFTVIERDYSKSKPYWLCKCICGNIKSVSTSNLTTGHVKSCGCYAKEVRSNVHDDLSGKVFGRLTALSVKKGDGRVKWNCVCICGKTKLVWALSLKSGKTQSCGCLQKEKTSLFKTTHGQTASHLPNKETKEYKAWCLMKYRCNNPNYKEFNNYGGRGITVCDRWLHSFENFFEDMGKKPTSKHTLDRKDPNGNYEPSNCRWATQRVQQGNRNNNVWHEQNGVRMILADWARKANVGYDKFFYIVKRYGFDVAYKYFFEKKLIY